MFGFAQLTIETLQKNELASESNLIIYSDEANNKNVQENVDKVQLYIDQSLIIIPFIFSLLIGFTIGFIFLVLILYSIIIFKYTR